MRRVITFLGIVNTSKPVPDVTYELNGKPYIGKVFPVALRQFVDFEEMLVFVTEKAYETAYPFVEAVGDPRIKPVPIEDGSSSEEIWEIFKEVTNHVQQRDTVIFDITHAFRSIPFLVFLAAAYLRVVRDVNVEAIYYGALLMGKTDKPAPVIDLTPFAELLDWTAATYLFKQTGDAGQLARRLKDLHDLPFDSAAIRELTDALYLNLTDEARDKAFALHSALDATDLRGERIEPFKLLIPSIQAELAQLAPEQPDHADINQKLRDQYHIVLRNYERGQLLSAFTVASEWMATLLCREARYTQRDPTGATSHMQWSLKVERALAKTVLGNEKEGFPKFIADPDKVSAIAKQVEKGERVKPAKKLAYDLWIRNPVYASDLANTYALVSDVRNQLNHAGEEAESRKTLADTMKDIESAMNAFKAIAIRAGIVPQD